MSDKRMSDTESLMWRLEKDPYLASTFANITILDRPPNMDALYARMERTSILFPRLRRRVLPAPGNFGNPTWVDDPSFDIRYHVRNISLPEPGDLRQLHHTVTDGQGGVELSLHYLDLQRDPAPLPPIDPELVNAAHAVSEPDATEALRGAMTDSLRLPIAVLRQVRDVLSDPSLIGTIGSSTSATVKGLIAQLNEVDSSRSPLWTSRSLRRRLETTRVSYHDMRGAAKSLGGTLNTSFVTAVAHAAGTYHREMGAPVESLRASMAISTRNESSGSNAFTLARMLVPTADMPIVERFSAINEILVAARTGAESSSLEALATVSSVVPTSIITRLARSQAETVDFATSNVRSAGVPLFMAGSQLLENYPVGPLGGVAFNVTLMSYMGSLDCGINIDEAAVESPTLLRDSLSQAFTELSAFAPERDKKSSTTQAENSATKRQRRWWRRSQ